MSTSFLCFSSFLLLATLGGSDDDGAVEGGLATLRGAGHPSP